MTLEWVSKDEKGVIWIGNFFHGSSLENAPNDMPSSSPLQLQPTHFKNNLGHIVLLSNLNISNNEVFFKFTFKQAKKKKKGKWLKRND